jgi:hypothetical protein
MMAGMDAVIASTHSGPVSLVPACAPGDRHPPPACFDLSFV